jgi:C-terminal processing protease CtpA/Prc
VGQVFVQFTHNDKQSSRNTAYNFEAKPQALAVTRLVVIATRGSASASEAIINGLRPYMDVKVVGDATYGKPVGQYEFDLCEKVLYPVSFLLTNSRGEADYFAGIPADCAAADDVDHALASPEEASLAEALYVVRNGRCRGTAAAQAELQARFRARVGELPRDGWRQMLNAW